MGIMEMNVVRCYPLKSDGKIKAYVDISIGDYVVKGFKIIEGKKGLFVQVPTVKGKDERRYNIFFPATAEAREVLENLIIGAYNQI